MSRNVDEPNGELLDYLRYHTLISYPIFGAATVCECEDPYRVAKPEKGFRLLKYNGRNYVIASFRLPPDDKEGDKRERLIANLRRIVHEAGLEPIRFDRSVLEETIFNEWRNRARLGINSLRY